MPHDPTEDEPARKLDYDSMDAIEHGGEGVARQRRWWRRRMKLKEAMAASGAPVDDVPSDPNLRICPHCKTRVRAADEFTEVLCTECGKAIPGAVTGEAETAKYSDSLAGRMTSSISFYTGFGSAALYPLPALPSILLGMGIAMAAIAVPGGLVLAFAAGSSLNPISEDVHLSWIGLFVTAMFVIEGVYFGAVNYHVLVDSIRTTASGNEKPPGLEWNLVEIGVALLGYLAIGLYYLAILTLLYGWANGWSFTVPTSEADLQPLRSPGSLFVLAVLTFMVPMTLIGLGSGRQVDGLNPVRVIQSILAVPAHYAFLFLIVVFYLGIYVGILVAVMDWAGQAILTAAREGISQGLTPLGMGLVAWAVVIGVGFYGTYALGRILGLFARTYKSDLEFDL